MKLTTHNDLGEKYLVEDCQNIRVETITREARKDVVKSLVRGTVEISGFKVNLIGKPLHHGGQRFWFVCPTCNMAVGVIYKHPLSENIGCRQCLNLDYKSRRFKGMVENGVKM